VRVVEAAKGKDAADHLAAGLDPTQFLVIPPNELATPANGDQHPGDSPTNDTDGGDPALPRFDVRDVPDPFVVARLDWLAQGFLVRGTHGEIAGPEKSLKSHLALALAVGVALGVPVLGRFAVPERQRVLVLVGEGGERAFLRLVARVAEAYGAPTKALVRWLRYTTTAIPLGPLGRDALADTLRDVHPALVIIDPWYAYQPPGIHSSDLFEVGPVLRQLQAITEAAEATLMAVNHFNHAKGFDLNRITMAGHAEWADSWVLVDHREPPDVDAGRFGLKLGIGSRQWGGVTYHLDFNLGRFDPTQGTHDSRMSWSITSDTAVRGGERRDDVDEPIANAKLAVVRAFNRSRTAGPPQWAREQIKGRVGIRRSPAVTAAIEEMIDAGALICVDDDPIKPGARFTLRFDLGPPSRRNRGEPPQQPPQPDPDLWSATDESPRQPDQTEPF
jgi:hypothetical protein